MSVLNIRVKAKDVLQGCNGNVKPMYPRGNWEERKANYTIYRY